MSRERSWGLFPEPPGRLLKQTIQQGRSRRTGRRRHSSHPPALSCLAALSRVGYVEDLFEVENATGRLFQQPKQEASGSD